jgi:uncharacterized protein with ATP-grasp and redox domains
MLRQVLEASRMATDDIEIQEQILNDSLKILLNYKQFSCSPDLALAMHQTVKKHSKKLDPYDRIKERDINASKKAYPLLKSFLLEKDNSLYWALKIAATGNIIDSAIYNNIDVEHCIENELEKGFSICDIDSFEDKLKKTKTLLIIGDNAGETVFDKVLAEHLLGFNINIIYAVRDKPIINDATVKEAYESGLDSCTTIVSTGSDAPGAILEKCSNEFIDLFNKSDIVISKGQGNYEALSDCERDIFFLLKAKCPMISNKLGVNLNEYVFKRN